MVPETELEPALEPELEPELEPHMHSEPLNCPVKPLPLPLPRNHHRLPRSLTPPRGTQSNGHTPRKAGCRLS